MQLPLAGAEAEPEPTNTPAAIKAATDAENRACRMTPPFEVGQIIASRQSFRQALPSHVVQVAAKPNDHPPSPIGCAAYQCRVLAEPRHAASISVAPRAED